jgi:pimeloyl-ACP methyl ester carboxylesterase
VDAELERWKAGGQYFDYLGFDVFYRKQGSGPTLLLIHGYPFIHGTGHRYGTG